MICVNYYDYSLPILVFFIIGFLIGLLIILLIWYFCPISKIKSKFITSRISFLNSNNDKPKNVTDKKTEISLNIKFDKKKLVNLNFYEENYQDTNNEEKKFIYYDNFDFMKLVNYTSYIDKIGVADLVTSDVVVQKEDIKSYYDLDFQYMNDRVTGHMYLVQQLLNLLFAQKLLSKEDYNYHMQKHGNRYRQEINDFNDKCQNIVTKIQTNNEGKLPSNSEKEDLQLQIIEQLPPQADQMINQIIESQSAQAQYIIDKLQTDKKLSKDDASEILKIYLQNKQILENHLNDFKRNAQLRHEARLKNFDSKFKQLIIDDNVNNDGYREREDVFSNETLVKIDKLSPSERDQIMKEYRANVNNIKNKHHEELKRQKLLLESKMKKVRNEEIVKAIDYRKSELKKIPESSTKCSLLDSSKFLNKYGELEESIDEDISNIMQKMDKVELDEYSKLTNKISQTVNTEISNLEMDIIQSQCQKLILDPNSIKMIMANNQKNTTKLQMGLEMEKKKQWIKMNQILNERYEKRSEELENGIQGQLNEEAKQEAIFKMTVDNQLNLPQDLKKKIIEEGKSNAIAVNNQLESVKIRQQKLMELKLAKRVQQKANLLESQSNQQIISSSSIEKANKTDAYAELVKQFEQEKTKVLLETRDKLVEETKAALKQQEESMAAIMAKYMVSHARKMKRKKNLENLYQNLFNEINKKTSKSMPAQQIMEQYVNEKDYIRRQRSSVFLKQKEQLDKALQERKKQVQIETNEESRRHYTDQLMELQNCGINKEAVNFIDSRFRDKISKSIEDIENEVKQQFEEELEKSKEQFDETNFDKSLNDSTIETLSKLVDMLNMSKDDLSDLINRISPYIDENTKNQVILDIYRKQKKSSAGTSKFENNRFDENDYIKPQSRRNQFDEAVKSGRKHEDNIFDENDYIKPQNRMSQFGEPSNNGKNYGNSRFNENDYIKLQSRVNQSDDSVKRGREYGDKRFNEDDYRKPQTRMNQSNEPVDKNYRNNRFDEDENVQRQSPVNQFDNPPNNDYFEENNVTKRKRTNKKKKRNKAELLDDNEF